MSSTEWKRAKEDAIEFLSKTHDKSVLQAMTDRELYELVFHLTVQGKWASFKEKSEPLDRLSGKILNATW